MAGIRPNPLIIGVALVALAAGVWAARALFPGESTDLRDEISAAWLNNPRPLPEFDLQDHNGDAYTRTRLEGAWTLVFFGFTHCPDVCPTTLHTMSRTARLIAEEQPGKTPEVVFLSVDPMRDTPERMAEYVPYFHPSFLGVTGDLAVIQQLTRDMGVAVQYVAEPDGVNYNVEHTASIFLINPDASLAAVFPTPHDAARIAREYVLISSEGDRM